MRTTVMKKTKRNKHQIHIQNVSRAKNIPSRYLLTKWTQHALQKIKSKTEISIRIVDKNESQTLNHQFRKKDKPTNVLAFPFETPEKLDIAYLGDLVICAPIVAKEAREQHKLLKAHWAHMVIHGSLHLQGYDHIKKNDAFIMENLEIKLLTELKYPNPYN